MHQLHSIELVIALNKMGVTVGIDWRETLISASKTLTVGQAQILSVDIIISTVFLLYAINHAIIFLALVSAAAISI